MLVVVGDAAVVAAHAMQTEQAEASFYGFGVGSSVNRYCSPPFGDLLAVAGCYTPCCMAIYQHGFLLMPSCAVMLTSRLIAIQSTCDCFSLHQPVCIIQAVFNQMAVNTYDAGLSWTG